MPAAAPGCCSSGAPVASSSCCRLVAARSPAPLTRPRPSLPRRPQAIFVDEQGFVLEGPTMNIGVVTHDRKLLVPPFDATLAGVTISRVMELAQEVSRGWRCDRWAPGLLRPRLHAACNPCDAAADGRSQSDDTQQNHHLSNEPLRHDSELLHTLTGLASLARGFGHGIQQCRQACSRPG
jgi:hypothetical protein